ncbi:hypothetical protein COA00_23600, partial [Bacillus cereus]
HLMDSIYQFIESIDKNSEVILSRIQRADMSIFYRGRGCSSPPSFNLLNCCSIFPYSFLSCLQNIVFAK